MKLLKTMPVLGLLTGCAAVPALTSLSGMLSLPPAGSQVLTATQVSLSKQNYHIVKVNAVGSSTGFSLFGLFSLQSPTYAEAMTQLCRSAGISEGKAQALVNLVHEHSSTYFILFGLPKITVRADVVEFTDGVPVPAKAGEAGESRPEGP